MQLPPGSVVSEAMLSQRLGIGRTPIREALQRLGRERLVTILPRRGVIVSEIDVKRQLRLLELRREVERLVARCAARRATVQERARFAELADQFEKSARKNDDITYMPETAKLHADIARGIAAADENRAAAAMDRLLDKIEQFTRATVSTDM